MERTGNVPASSSRTLSRAISCPPRDATLVECQVTQAAEA
jgi:hypothetical protein